MKQSPKTFSKYLSIAVLALGGLSACGDGSPGTPEQALCFDDTLYALNASVEMVIDYNALNSTAISQTYLTSHVSAVNASFDKYTDLISISTSQSSNDGEWTGLNKIDYYKKSATNVYALYGVYQKISGAPAVTAVFESPLEDRRATLIEGKSATYKGSYVFTDTSGTEEKLTIERTVTFVGKEHINIAAGNFYTCRYLISETYSDTGDTNTRTEWIYRNQAIKQADDEGVAQASQIKFN